MNRGFFFLACFFSFFSINVTDVFQFNILIDTQLVPYLTSGNSLPSPFDITCTFVFLCSFWYDKNITGLSYPFCTPDLDALLL